MDLFEPDYTSPRHAERTCRRVRHCMAKCYLLISAHRGPYTQGVASHPDKRLARSSTQLMQEAHICATLSWPGQMLMARLQARYKFLWHVLQCKQDNATAIITSCNAGRATKFVWTPHLHYSLGLMLESKVTREAEAGINLPCRDVPCTLDDVVISDIIHTFSS